MLLDSLNPHRINEFFFFNLRNWIIIFDWPFFEDFFLDSDAVGFRSSRCCPASPPFYRDGECSPVETPWPYEGEGAFSTLVAGTRPSLPAAVCVSWTSSGILFHDFTIRSFVPERMPWFKWLPLLYEVVEAVVAQHHQPFLDRLHPHPFDRTDGTTPSRHPTLCVYLFLLVSRLLRALLSLLNASSLTYIYSYIYVYFHSSFHPFSTLLGFSFSFLLYLRRTLFLKQVIYRSIYLHAIMEKCITRRCHDWDRPWLIQFSVCSTKQ